MGNTFSIQNLLDSGMSLRKALETVPKILPVAYPKNGESPLSFNLDEAWAEAERLVINSICEAALTAAKNNQNELLQYGERIGIGSIATAERPFNEWIQKHAQHDISARIRRWRKGHDYFSHVSFVFQSPASAAAQLIAQDYLHQNQKYIDRYVREHAAAIAVAVQAEHVSKEINTAAGFNGRSPAENEKFEKHVARLRQILYNKRVQSQKKKLRPVPARTVHNAYEILLHLNPQPDELTSTSTGTIVFTYMLPQGRCTFEVSADNAVEIRTPDGTRSALAAASPEALMQALKDYMN